MNLQESTNSSLIAFKKSWASKEEILTELTQMLFSNGYVSNKDEFLESVLEREKISETGMEDGFAIPHGKSSAVVKAGFAVCTLAKPLAASAWPSFDPENQVDTIFLLAVPTAQAGDKHLEILAELSRNLMQPSFTKKIREAKSEKEIWEALNIAESNAQETTTTNTNTKYAGKSVLAVTACATGIAHTYMAAEALEQAAKQMGIELYVEKQGANGIEDRFTKEQINNASAVLFAVDTKVKDKERFNGLPYVETKVADPLRHSKELLQKALETPQGILASSSSEASSDVPVSGKKSIVSESVTAVLTGIAYMIPLLVAGGLMMGIAKLIWVYGLQLPVGDIGSVDYNTLSTFAGFVHYLDAFGGMIFKFIYPIFSMYVAYSIADRVGIVSGFVGGMFATGLHYTFWKIDGGIPSGFLGALILGLTAGYVSKFLNEKIKLPKSLQAMKPMFLIPGISVFVVFLLNMYIVDPVFGELNKSMAAFITSMTGSGQLVLSSIIAAATAFDLGGPINKAAGAVAIGLAADNIFPLTARVLAIVIPPIGLGLATMIDKFVVKRRVFSEDLRIVGNTSFLLGFLAISEGAIPFMLKNPLITIPINIIGAILGACTAVSLGAVQWLPLPAIWGWPLVENIPAYLIGLLVGVLFIAFANIFVRYYILVRKEKQK